MNDQERLKELNNILFNEIQSDLTYNEKKEFTGELCDKKVVARLLDNNLKKKRRFSVFIIVYVLFILALLVMFLMITESLPLIVLISIAIILLPVLVVNLFANKNFLGYQKLDLVLRLITKFYVK